jgi:hypothetical protein
LRGGSENGDVERGAVLQSLAGRLVVHRHSVGSAERSYWLTALDFVCMMQSERGYGWTKTEVATMTTESATGTRSFTMGPAYRIIEVLPNLLTPDSNRPLLIAGFWLFVTIRTEPHFLGYFRLGGDSPTIQ